MELRKVGGGIRNGFKELAASRARCRRGLASRKRSTATIKKVEVVVVARSQADSGAGCRRGGLGRWMRWGLEMAFVKEYRKNVSFGTKESPLSVFGDGFGDGVAKDVGKKKEII